MSQAIVATEMWVREEIIKFLLELPEGMRVRVKPKSDGTMWTEFEITRELLLRLVSLA